MAPPPAAERMASLVILAASHLAALCISSPLAHALHFDENTNTIFPSSNGGHLLRGKNDIKVFYQTGVSQPPV